MANCEDNSRSGGAADDSTIVNDSQNLSIVPANDSINSAKDTQSGSVDAHYDVNNAPDSVDVEISSPAKNRYKKKVTGRLTALRKYKETWFDSPQNQSFLHEKCISSYFPLLTRRFRCAICFIILGTILWSIYCGVSIPKLEWYFSFVVVLLFFIELACLGFTFTFFYRKFQIVPALIMGPGTCIVILAVYACLNDPNYEVSAFATSVTIIILMYTTIHLPLTLVFLVGIAHSLALEILNVFVSPASAINNVIVGRIMLHICLHSLGVYLFIILQVRRYSLFQKLQLSTRNKRIQEEDKKIIERMLHSLMPPAVAKNVIDTQVSSGTGVITYRPFQIDKVDHVSILFADIVGFTKMSSNKTAKHLVHLLSDLFGRFDKLCETLGCEKISTLGDCYYCVSGCPEANKDHAKCCVEMGLRMIEAIQEFDKENDEQVNMRVGVHTGTVLCGIVGSKQFKFDVWSNDVTLANIMEATGKPGRVHISKTSYEYLEDEYEVEEGEDCEDNRTVASLIEQYDAENKKYTVTHQEKKQKITTFFIVKRKEKNKPKEVESTEDPVQLAVENEDKTVKEPSETDKLEPIDYVSPVPLLKPKDKAGNFLFKDDRTKENIDGVTVEEVEANLDTIRSRLCAPPLHPCFLTFHNEEIEKDLNMYNVDEMPDKLHVKVEVVMSFVIFFIISIASFIMFQRPAVWLALFPIFFIIEIAFIFKILFRKKYEILKKYPDHWIVRSIESTFLAFFPILAVFSNFYCPGFIGRLWQEKCFCITFMIALFNFTTFTTVNSMMRSVTAILSFFIFILIHTLTACTQNSEMEYDLLYDDNTTDIVTQMPLPNLIFSKSDHFIFLIDLDLILHLLLILFLNRECEISYRICYHCDAEANFCQKDIKHNKDQLEWLLHNIIPEHISSKLINGRYSKNHQYIGVIFAGLVNFNELYEESYQGGREMLRVLNELVGDYEDLLDDPRFKDVEKIKTITSTFMAASGLDERKCQQNKHKYAHLFSLMLFAMEMQKVIEYFNRSMINFEFILNIGYNFGEVTAGVIGTTKLLFDIWGDTVNVSSRMYSNGAARRIQVPSSNIEILSEMFDFEYRGTILIKGKGEMGTYLLVKQKEGAKWD